VSSRTRRTAPVPVAVAADVPPYRVGLAAATPLHALPVLTGRDRVLLRPVCGAHAPDDLSPGGDWRELPAAEQCPWCERVVPTAC